MRQMYDYDAMVLNTPRQNYRHSKQYNPDSYVQVWEHRLAPQGRYHLSVAPHSNQNGFHITSIDGAHRVYFDRHGTKIRRPSHCSYGQFCDLPPRGVER